MEKTGNPESLQNTNPALLESIVANANNADRDFCSFQYPEKKQASPSKIRPGLLHAVRKASCLRGSEIKIFATNPFCAKINFKKT